MARRSKTGKVPSAVGEAAMPVLAGLVEITVLLCQTIRVSGRVWWARA
ncbi:MAG: hypothetical protein ACYC1D_05790 [Acidimicrobiales bacterium]